MARDEMFTSPFAPLQLTPTDTETLEKLSRVILRNYVTQYEEFERHSVTATREGKRALNERIWKPVRHKGNVRAFVQRNGRTESTTIEVTRLIKRYSTAGGGLIAPPDLPVMLVEGSIPGTLDDLMYGVLAHSMDAARVRTTYVDDNMRNGAVLATLTVPTENEPFDSLVIRWAHNASVQGVLRSVISDRDYVYMERTGTALTASGERIGFHLLHSVNFPQTHELPGLTRGDCSVCGIFRNNIERNEVELYVRAVVDARGSVFRPMVVLTTADTCISVAKYIESSHRKKLAWHLRKPRKVATSTTRDQRGANESDACVMCNKAVSRAAGVLRGDATRKGKCALCGLCVCSSCQIKKTLSEVVAGALKQHKFAFCCFCYGDVSRASALEIARDEVTTRDTEWSILRSACSSIVSSQ